MKKYQFLLFDADDTILDFHAAQDYALENALIKLGITPCSEYLQGYDKINHELWRALEKGEVGRDFIVNNRFKIFFDAYNIKKDPVCASEYYFSYLQQGYHCVDGAEEILNYYFDKVPMYVVTNGIGKIQAARLEGSGLKKYFKASFISEEIGAQKPQPEFFAYVAAHIPNFNQAAALIIGDTLTSDILGGNNYGIDTCYVNRMQKKHDGNILPTYEISDIRYLRNIITV